MDSLPMTTISYDRDSPLGRDARKRALALVASLNSADGKSFGIELTAVMNLPKDELTATVDALAELARTLAVMLGVVQGTDEKEGFILDVLDSIEETIDSLHPGN